MKHFFNFFIIFLILVLQFSSLAQAYAKTKKIDALIEKTKPRGFNKKCILIIDECKEKKLIRLYFKNRINLKKHQIREFDYIPENKPSGIQLKDNIYIKPRVSVSYIMEIIENVNDAIGIYDEAVQEELNSRLGKNEDNFFEGGFEINWYF
ncbi:MAG: hypothetical protein RBR08_10780 [Desulforegulaceae bacterium]|nr:hypothetical protein [Desulforegulaceae bacterium]